MEATVTGILFSRRRRFKLPRMLWKDRGCIYRREYHLSVVEFESPVGTPLCAGFLA